MGDPCAEFEQEVASNIKALGEDSELKDLSVDFLYKSGLKKYTYNFSALGRPLIQLPQDIVAVQELVWKVKPDLIIETGIAHGGSLILSASMLALLDYCDAVESGEPLDPQKTKLKVLGLDIDIRAHNRREIEAHPLHHHIHMIEGSSIDQDIVDQVYAFANDHKKIMVFLDSNHTHDHVLNELKMYAGLASPQSYCVVFDTCVEEMPEGYFGDRPWGKGNNPHTAVHAFLNDLQANDRLDYQQRPINFAIDKTIENKIMITVAPDGFLKRL